MTASRLFKCKFYLHLLHVNVHTTVMLRNTPKKMMAKKEERVERNQTNQISDL